MSSFSSLHSTTGPNGTTFQLAPGVTAKFGGAPDRRPYQAPTIACAVDSGTGMATLTTTRSGSEPKVQTGMPAKLLNQALTETVFLRAASGKVSGLPTSDSTWAFGLAEAARAYGTAGPAPVPSEQLVEAQAAFRAVWEKTSVDDRTAFLAKVREPLSAEAAKQPYAKAIRALMIQTVYELAQPVAVGSKEETPAAHRESVAAKGVPSMPPRSSLASCMTTGRPTLH